MSALALSAVTLFGFLLLGCLPVASRLSLGERLALGYGVGLGVVTYAMFGYLALGFRLSSASMAAWLIGLLMLAGALAAWRRRPNIRVESPGSATGLGQRLLSFAGGLVLLVLCVSAFVAALYWPIHSWDALTMFDGRARAILAERSLAPLRHDWYWGSFPLLTSLGHAMVYFLGGTVPGVIYPAYYVALLLLFYDNVATLSGRLMAVVGTVTLASTPLLWAHAAEPLTNLPFAFYYSAGTIYVYRWVASSDKLYLILGGVLLGLCAWTRYGAEPLFVAVLAPVAVYALVKRQYAAPLLLLLAYASLSAPWLLYQRYVVGANAAALYGVQLSLSTISRALETAGYLWTFVTSPETHGTVWLVFLLLLLMNARRWQDPSLFVASVVLLDLAAWTASIALTGLSVEVLAVHSGERLLLSFLPVAALYCVVNPLARNESGPSRA